MLWQSRLHTASETFVRHKQFVSGSIFGFRIHSIHLIGKDEEYGKPEKHMQTQCAIALTVY